MSATLVEVYSTPGGTPTWTAVAVPQAIIVRRLTGHVRGGIPTFVFEVHGGKLPGLPDPWEGKVIRVTINGVLRFLGDVIRLDPPYRKGLGWCRTYTAFGLRNRGDWIPHTDSNNGLDSSSYNLQSDSQGPDYLPSRSGRTAGEILLDVLSMPANASALASVGIGNYSSAGYGAAGIATMAGTAITSVAPAAGGGGTGYTVSPLVVTVGGSPTTYAQITASIGGGAVTGYTVVSGGDYASPPEILVTTLPLGTVQELEAITIQPPAPVYCGGEKLLSAVDGFLSTWCPNFLQYVEPGGLLRYLDQRTYAPVTFTMGVDPIRPSGVSRDLSECFQRVLVRGQQLAELYRFSTALGTLSSSPFAHDGLTVAQAEAQWVPADYFQPQLTGGRVEGTCTCPDTLHVTITPDISTTAFAANAYDQTVSGRHGLLALTYTAGTDITTMAQRMVVANTALAAGGTCTLTLDRAIPNLLYNAFTMTGLTQGASAVWVDYALPAWAGPKVAKQSYLAVPLKFASGNAETLISTATGVIRWSSNGNPPYSEGISGISVDNGSGIVRFNYPTYLSAGGVPADVEVWIPIYTGVNQAVCPANAYGGGNSYSGTSNTVDGLTKTLTVSVRAWRDPANQAAMNAYACDLLDSVKDAVCEAEICYLGLYDAALEPGFSFSITGASYTTGWEGLDMPNVETQVEWSVDGLQHVTTIRVSSRRAHFSAEAFLHPDRTGIVFDWGGSIGTEGPGMAMSGPDVGGVMDAAASFGSDQVEASSQAALNAPTSMGDLGLPTSMDDLGVPVATGTEAMDSAGEGLQALGSDL